MALETVWDTKDYSNLLTEEQLLLQIRGTIERGTMVRWKAFRDTEDLDKVVAAVYYEGSLKELEDAGIIPK